MNYSFHFDLKVHDCQIDAAARLAVAAQSPGLVSLVLNLKQLENYSSSFFESYAKKTFLESSSRQISEG